MSPIAKSDAARETIAALCDDLGLTSNAFALRSALCDRPWDLREQLGRVMTIAGGYHALVTRAHDRSGSSADDHLGRMASDALALEKVASAAIVACDERIAYDHDCREAMAREKAAKNARPILGPRAVAHRRGEEQ